METFLRGLSAGFIVGVVCVAYVLIRLARVHKEMEAQQVELRESHQISKTWMLMALYSSGSVVWGFLGAGIYYMVQSHFYFVLFSLSLGFILTSILFFTDTKFKADKIILVLVITIGLGFLIPYLI